MKTAELVDRCHRALSPYDCERHYAALAARGSDRADTEQQADLFATLRPEQRRAITRGVRRAIRAVEAERLAHFDAVRAARAAAAPHDPAAMNLHRQDRSRDRRQRPIRNARAWCRG